MTDIFMPRLSDAMEEGTILTWLKANGEHVDTGAELVEIETDKATMTYESPQAGFLEIVVAQGASVAVGTVIARMGIDASLPQAPSGTAPVRTDDAAILEPAVDERASTSRTASTATNGDRAIRSTPLARRLASRHGVDLSTVSGTGPRGRICRADVEVAAGVEPAPALAVPPPGPAAEIPSVSRASSSGESSKGEVTVIELTRPQQVVARRMAEAKATIPEFQVEAEVRLDAAIGLRAQLKELGGEATPSLNDIVVKACALALRAHPRANGSYKNGVFELYGRVNIGVAVAAQDALVVPTVTDADTRTLTSIASETRRLAVRVRNGEITPPELSGATFTVSNLGMYGMSAITPVINPPQAAILGVGASRSIAAVVDGELAEQHLVTLRLTCDHRILYGAEAAQFLQSIRASLEQPLSLVL